MKYIRDLTKTEKKEVISNMDIVNRHFTLKYRKENGFYLNRWSDVSPLNYTIYPEHFSLYVKLMGDNPTKEKLYKLDAFLIEYIRFHFQSLSGQSLFIGHETFEFNKIHLPSDMSDSEEKLQNGYIIIL